MRILGILLLAIPLAFPAIGGTWVVVTLDRIDFSGNLIFWPRFKGNPIVLAAVAGTGDAFQGIVWPAAGWYTFADEGSELVQDTEAIPLFALPLEEMGSRLGVALEFMAPREFAWDHPGATGSLASLGSMLRRALSGGGSTASDSVYIATFGPAAWSRERTSRSGEVRFSDAVVRFRYSIRRVSLPEGLRAWVRLEGIKTVENGDFAHGEIFVQARVIYGFGRNGAPLQRTVRIPARGHYSMGDGDEKALSAVLYDGPVSPFLYVEVMVWDEDNPEVGDQHDLLGGFFGLWLPWRLTNLPGGGKRLVIPKSTPDGEVLIYLRIEGRG